MKGLHPKYDVRKGTTGEPVQDCFVLKPVTDPHALVALRAYAASCEADFPELAKDLNDWIDLIEGARS